MEGFLNFRITPWLRRLITRGIAIVPAVCIIGLFGEEKTTELLVASQVVNQGSELGARGGSANQIAS